MAYPNTHYKEEYKMIVNRNGIDFSDEEIRAYAKHIEDEFPNCEVVSLDLTIDPDDKDFINVQYEVKNKPNTNVKFDRIRRITGYLVTMTRANNAKTAEINDRIKHSTIDPNH